MQRQCASPQTRHWNSNLRLKWVCLHCCRKACLNLPALPSAAMMVLFLCLSSRNGCLSLFNTNLRVRVPLCLFSQKWTPRQHRASLPFFPQWAPKAAPHPSSSNLPETVGGMVGSTPPPVCLSSTTYWNLLAVGVPPAIAREAARRHVDDFDAALDWACSSDRRHTRVGVPDCVDLVDSSSNASPPPGAASPNPVNLRVPASWLASPTIADAALAPHPESLDAAAPPPLPICSSISWILGLLAFCSSGRFCVC